jgi:hypothetical protein
MQLVLEGKTLEDLATGAENFLLELEGQPTVAKGKRGRPTKAEVAARTAANAQETAAAAPPPAKPNNAVSKDNVMAAMKELIASKGAPAAAALLAAEFAPATRSIEIPEARWQEFITRVAQVTAPAPQTAADLV